MWIVVWLGLDRMGMDLLGGTKLVVDQTTI